MEEVTALCLAWQSATLAKGEYEITLCIWGLWLASAGGYHYSWFTLASHIPKEVFLIFSKYFQVVKL